MAAAVCDMRPNTWAMAVSCVTPIDQVKIGEKVLTTNQVTGKLEDMPVTALHLNLDSDLMDVRILTASGTSTLHATQNHLFYDLATQSWRKADNLKKGDRLWTSNGDLATIVSTTVVSGSAEMWDLTVSGNHDFYVVASASAVLVHNCPDDDSKKISKGAMKFLKGIMDLADKTVSQAIRIRGGGASQVNELQTGMGEQTVRAVAEDAANGDEQAIKAMKMIKQAGTQGKGGK
jgi:hypothetical protein